MSWSLHEGKKFLAPLKFSNGKTQEDIVKEVLELIRKDNKIIFVKGMCGTGKSTIALNIAKALGKTSIVVPGKNLQRQYKRDYERDKHVLKKNNEKLKISIITGRKNHTCKFLEEFKSSIPKREINSKLANIFEKKRDESEIIAMNDLSADNKNIPCKLEIIEKNWNKIKEYLKQNGKIDLKEFNDTSQIKRISVAGACPYWSPVLPEKYEAKQFQDLKKKSYIGLNEIKFNFYERKPGCKFYEQFNSYIDSDVIVFNSLKYKLETLLNRKPQTEVEIIDECDEFLDSFSNNRVINVDRLQNSVLFLAGITKETDDFMKELIEITKKIKRDEKIRKAVESGEILELKETPVYDLLKILLKSPEVIYSLEDENYILNVWETARNFDGFFDETHLIFEKKDNNLLINAVTTNLAKRFQDMINKNKHFVLMSGTIHSEEVLKNIFGLKDFKIVEAETNPPGKVDIIRTGMEFNCKYSNFQNGKADRKKYLLALNKCIQTSKKPSLVHINSFGDLPTQQEIEQYKTEALISREKLREMQENDKEGRIMEDFKKKKMDVLFSTKVARGIDFPGEECNSIIFTKYPNPDVKDAFWRILMKTKPKHYWEFYKDKAKRELLQKLYRGLRFKGDHVYLLSPDLRVLEQFEN